MLSVKCINLSPEHMIVIVIVETTTGRDFVDCGGFAPSIAEQIEAAAGDPAETVLL